MTSIDRACDDGYQRLCTEQELRWAGQTSISMAMAAEKLLFNHCIVFAEDATEEEKQEASRPQISSMEAACAWALERYPLQQVQKAVWGWACDLDFRRLEGKRPRDVLQCFSHAGIVAGIAKFDACMVLA